MIKITYKIEHEMLVPEDCYEDNAESLENVLITEQQNANEMIIDQLYENKINVTVIVDRV